MSRSKSRLRWQDLSAEALPFARRAADVRFRGAAALFRADGSLDHDDVRQEVTLHIWKALKRFDPNRSALNTFVERLAETCVSSILRRISAKKRWGQPAPESVSSLDPRLAFDSRLDINAVLKRLGPHDRRVAHQLMEDYPAETARRLGISRAAVYRSVGRIRAALVEGGYGDYFAAAGHFAEISRI